MANKAVCAILGSGNIGTDLLIKILRSSSRLEPGAMIGIDPASDGLARARDLGVETISSGLQGFLGHPLFAETRIFFDATSAGAHRQHAAALEPHFDKFVIDLTPAAIGPYVVPAVNPVPAGQLRNVNMVTCGGQATIPVVAAVSRVAKVHYAEIIASIASLSAGPGTRANIDEFTETTARAIERVGGARRGKAIIVLNPAEPPLIMRDTVITLSDREDRARIERAITAMVATVQGYVPGFRLKQEVQFENVEFGVDNEPGRFLKSTAFLEVEGAGHYLPAYAGNLDIMTSAAVAAAEQLVEQRNAA